MININLIIQDIHVYVTCPKDRCDTWKCHGEFRKYWNNYPEPPFPLKTGACILQYLMILKYDWNILASYPISSLNVFSRSALNLNISEAKGQQYLLSLLIIVEGCDIQPLSNERNTVHVPFQISQNLHH